MLRKMVSEIFIGRESEGMRKIFEIEKIPFKIDERINGYIKVGENKVIINPEIMSYENIVKVDFAKLILKDKFYNKMNYVLSKFNFDGVNLPVKEIYEISGEYETLAEFSFKEKKVPAIVKFKDYIIFLFNIDKLFIDLIYEEYFEKEDEKHVLGNELLDSMYKKIPYRLRIAMYRRYYKRVHNRLKDFKTDFPIYPGSFVLMELIKESIKQYTPLIRLGKWPENKEFCLLLTHDVEPSKYSYTTGINELLDVLDKYDREGTIMLVAEYAKKYLNQGIIERLKKHDVGSHGLLHDRKFLIIEEKKRVARLKDSKRIIENLIGKDVLFFRAPALQRPKELSYELEDAGYKYDSSMIDVQREEPYCGKGNSFFLPFYKGDSFILEFPVSAPDCISPYFFGMSIEETIDLFKMKLEWLRDINGLGVFIVHAPAWGEEDKINRLKLLEAILEDKRVEDAWSATASEIYQWWKKRESLEIEIRKGKIVVSNFKKEDIEGCVLIIEDGKKSKGRKLRRVESGEKIVIENV